MVVPTVENYLNTILPNEGYLNTIIHLVEVEDFNILPNKEEDFLNIEEELIEEEDYPNILLINFFLKLLNFLYSIIYFVMTPLFFLEEDLEDDLEDDLKESLEDDLKGDLVEIILNKLLSFFQMVNSIG